ncbi:CLUMA_CG011869, isoform A [Clunio marinus]|uniref:CLUMA_CG011869, isoform A n=1 Tax=Clunio marinus TaxID=568069 RepID=A0A1J1IJ94_9DIPT|nr:CLUMA_CG011869, isoform A [Clunio marinus]
METTGKVDDVMKLILGLIWTIILRFQIQEIEIDVDEDNETSEKKSAKDALLLWCQRKTHGYPNVNIQDFTSSWRSGLGFNALIHSHRPDLFDFNSLQPGRNMENLNHAFDVADRELGIPRLLDAEDLAEQTRPDERSVLTYVASYYHTFARMKNEQKSGKRIANIVGKMMDADGKIVQYETLTSTLLTWIRNKTKDLEKRNFPNSLEGIQQELLNFKQYRTIEKPPKYKERSEVEALYFHVNTLLKSLNQPQYTPQDGQLVKDIEKAWQLLENAEHNREVALRNELLRQEKLEQLNYKFERKSVLRENYLKEMIQVLSDPRYGANIRQVDATVKKHEAISADILARVERFNDLTDMSNELQRENYHGKDRVKKREEEVLKKWNELLKLLEHHKNNLNQMSSLMNLLREIDTTIASIKTLQALFASEDVGPHLLGVEELLQAHSLQELQVTALGDAKRRYMRQGESYKKSDHKEAPLLAQKLESLEQLYNELQKQSANRRSKLEEARDFYHFLEDHENEEGWLIDKQRICKAAITAKDLRAVMSLQQKHKVLEDEMKVRKPKSQQLKEVGKKLNTEQQHSRGSEVSSRLESLDEHWKALEDLVELRKRQLEDAAEAYQFYTDANEADSWLNEKMALVVSKDFGVDEPSAQALLQRHRDLQGELNAYSGDIKNLNQQADKLMKAGICTLDLSQEPEPVQDIEQEEWVNETRLVSKEVWEEEPVEKLEPRTVTEMKMMSHVKALYPFEGQGMKMAKGETMVLLNKTNPDWWSVRKSDGVEGFIPANYVKEIEQQAVPVLVRKMEKVKGVQKVKKTILVKQVVPVKRIKPTKVSQIRPLIKRRAEGDPTAIDSSDSVEKRCKRINLTYDQLQDMAVQRHALLEDSICLFGFFRECDDFEKWIKDKEKMLKTEDPKDNVETAKRKFEKFLTDLSASSKRIEAIDMAVDDFARQGHSQLDKIKIRQRQIHQLWQHLNHLKAQKEKSLEGASSVELFNRTCEEAKDWMQEKMTQLDTAELGPDLKTVQALQRRHQNLERELEPLKEKVSRVDLLGNSVKNSYPSEKENVAKSQKDIKDMWQKVQAKALDRRSRLENAVGEQIFTNSAKNLLNWVDSVKNQLNADETARDVETANNLLKKHNDLADEIKSQDDEFSELLKLGRQLTERNPKLKEIPVMMEKLAAEQEAVHRGWTEKEKWLQQCVELQMFNREADKIDATTKAHEAYLEYTDLGNSLDDVEAILKRHNDFENTLGAQDKILKGFSDNVDKLIKNKHYDATAIDERRNQVLARRQRVKEQAQNRQNALQASRDFQKFVADIDDLNNWLDNKTKIAGDESYKDLSNLPRKLQKHRAFERELRANEGQLRMVNKDGESLVKAKNRSNEVEQMLNNVNKKWKDLIAISLEKGRRLEQALLQRDHNKNIEDAKKKLGKLETALQSKQVGNDLRSCKDLMNKHQILEADIAFWEQKIDELVQTSEEMAHEGHFDANNIKNETKNLQNQFKNLKDPVEKRRAALDESLKFHKFNFEVDSELQWINERLPAASSETMGQNLYQAQSMDKKHKKMEAEINGHQPIIDKTLAFGQTLIQQNHPESEKARESCGELENAWQNLQEKAEERAKKLELSLKAQQYLSDAGEIETWLSEKNNILKSTDYGRDRDSATKLLTKHKTSELELDTYSAIIQEMGHTAQLMVTSKHPDSKTIVAKQQIIEKMLKSLQKLAAQRQLRLMESLYRHEYFAESADLENWIKEQELAVNSEDYGLDYEHLLILQNKFDDLKHRIEVGAERFNQCDEFAKKLIGTDSQYASDVEKRQEHLRRNRDSFSKAALEVLERHEVIRNAWENLLKQLGQREQRLHAAGEIHRFHRDVAEALFRIQDKNATLSNELGKDLNSALALYRKHEGFENDLVALEAQLQVLVEDSVRLQSKYPGDNAQAIAQQQETVVDAWNTLKENSATRSDQLAASCDFQSFLTQARDLMSWASNLRATLQAEEHVSDAAGATALKLQHDAIYNEIEAREGKFRTLSELSDSMVQTGHYAATEVEEKCTALLEERQKLHNAWNKKKILLEQKIDLFCFLRDAKQIDNMSSAQEATLSSTDYGVTVETVQDLVKRHDELEKLIQQQDEKVVVLQDHGRRLVEQNHYDSSNIRRRLEEVVDRRSKVKALSQARRKKLANALLYAQFVRDVAEAEAWINEKQKKLEADSGSFADETNIEEKIKRLQKHQAFQAEISANDSRIQELKDKSETLIKKQHESTKEIKDAMQRLLEAWNNLLQAVNAQGKGLEEAQDILEFNNQLEKIDAWIRDKDLMVQANDTGRDLEHCNALKRKLDDVGSDMRVDDQRIKSINVLADKLVSQEKSPDEIKNVQQKRTTFNNRWRQLQGAINAYRVLLEGAYEIHVFNRDLDDTCERIAEKSLAMSSDDSGRDLTAVEAMRRKQDTLERDMTAVKQKIFEHENDAAKLMRKYPERADDINKNLMNLKQKWDQLEALREKRRQQLEDAYQVHKFLADVKELEKWSQDITKKMEKGVQPSTIPECVAQIELHEERKAEINGRDNIFKEMIQHGQKLSTETTEKADDVAYAQKKLEEVHQKVHIAWKDRAKRLNDAHQLQLFKDLADQKDAWLASKEAFLNNDDLGESFAAVEVLIKKHEAFEKLLLTSTVVDELQEFANKVLAQEPYEITTVELRLDGVKNRMERLKTQSSIRRKKLNESLQFQQFLRNLYEVERWLGQKLQVALDENYRETSNLQSKIQKHGVFDAELLANTSRVAAVITEGEALIESKHYASAEIQQQIEMLESEWGKLQEASREKKIRLSEAYEALIFNRSLDEFNSWMDEIESHLSSEDYGKDLPTVNNLIKKHQVLEADVIHHGEFIEQIKTEDQAFLNSDHFMKNELHEKAMYAIKRYHSLNEPMTIRGDNLDDSLLLHQFLRDSEDEIQWLAEKEPLIASKDLGSNLTAVQSLQKKHQALESEILSQEPTVSAIIYRGQQMIQNGHFANAQIESRCNELQRKLILIRDLVSVRRLRLLDAVESQMFYAEANECESWIKEKRPILISSDFGKDEDAVQSQQKKLETLQRELVSFVPTVEKVGKLADNLCERGHFDNEKIRSKSTKIQQQLEELQKLSIEREKRISEQRKFLEFMREIEDLHEWIGDQMTTASSEEYGTDVEHVQQLTLAFESSVSTITANEPRVQQCQMKADELIKDQNPYKEIIQVKRDETKQLWDELKELIAARQEALAGAKKVHVYDRTADETIAWINEKIADNLSEDYGQDLETIQALSRKHELFEIEIAAVREHVESVQAEAKQLADAFPDARDHIEVKREETIEAWTELNDKSQQRKVKLSQAEQLQAYFDEYRDLMAWINEMLAKITSPDLANDVSGAEALIMKIREHQAEVDAREEIFDNFYKTGRKLIKDKHFLANEVEDKIGVLEHRQKLLDKTLQNRREIYDLNLDTQLFLREATVLENWILSREVQLKDGELGETIPHVEDLIRKHEDFEKTVAAQEEKFEALKRITLLEQLFKKQKEDEEAAKRAEKERVEKERIEALKQKEVQRITEERRRNEKQIDGRTDKPPIFSSPQNKAQHQQQVAVEQPASVTGLKPSASSESLTQVQKSSSFVNIFGDRLRRGSEGNVKRAESMKVQPKGPKRTPSFTTRKRATSFKKNQKTENQFDLPPVEIQGMLERKHDLQSGGKRAPVRSWKLFHTVLCGQLLCFFKDDEDFRQRKATTAPVNILNAICVKAENYTKKKNVFRLSLPDGSEFLFLASSLDEMNDWVNKISFHANLPPNLQLMSYDETMKANSTAQLSPSKSSNTSQYGSEHDGSSVSSRTSSPDPNQRRDSNSSGVQTTPQMNFLQKQRELRERENQNWNSEPPPHSPTGGFYDKPPIPPRGVPPPVPQRQSSVEKFSEVEIRPKNINGSEDHYSNNPSNRPYSLQQPQSRAPLVVPNNGNGTTEEVWLRQGENRSSEPPPLPLTHPPFGSGMSHGSPMKFTTFHQHHQLVAHPQHNPTNGSYDGSNYPTQTIHVTNQQQHYMIPQQMHHHHQQQFFENNPPQLSSNYVPVNSYTKMSAPLGGHQQQRNTIAWHQQHSSSSTSPIRNGNSNESGWGQGRFDTGRPTSLPPQSSSQQQDGSQIIAQHRMSAESSSESEAGGITNKKEGKEKDRKGVFRIFSKKKSKNQQ